MRIRYYCDADSGLPHIGKHGVSERDVRHVLLHPHAILRGKGGTKLALGQTREGAALKVVFVQDPEPDSVFVVTAYRLGGKALRAYRRNRRKTWPGKS